MSSETNPNIEKIIKGIEKISKKYEIYKCQPPRKHDRCVKNRKILPTTRRKIDR